VNSAEVRRAWIDYQAEASTKAETNKQSQEAFLALFPRYRALSDPEREVANELLTEQVDSSDENVRFDALAIIREFRIVSTLPALRSLADRLERLDTPGAPFEWAKVNRLIGLLVEQRNGG
jgi:hypothetical protein